MKFFLSAAETEAIATSQVQAFVKQIPLLYLLLITNSTILGIVHFGLVPNILSIWIPGIMNAFCFVRLCIWINNRNKIWNYENSMHILKKLRLYSMFLTASIITWTLFLAIYGNATTRQDLIFFGVLTINSLAICQLQVRGLAMLALVLTSVAVFGHWIIFNDHSSLLRAIEEFTCVAVLLTTLNIHYKSFVDLVATRESLVLQNEKMKYLSDENFRIANQDSLTNLANRRLFFNTLIQNIKYSLERKRPFSIGLIDLDGFKTVNDVYGHSVGDELLKAAASRMLEVLGPKVFVARLGGDEFAIILPDMSDESKISDIGRSLEETLASPFLIESISAKVSASIGFAIFPQAGKTEHELFDRADHALYYAKLNARGSAVLFSKEHEQAIRLEALIEQKLRNAAIESEFELVFQPVVCAKTSRTVAFEALARWTNPTLGPISPSKFIPIAEKIDLIGSITVALFRKALTELVRWPTDVRLSFNLSVKDVVSPITTLRLVAMLAEFEVNAARIDFEITETVLLNDFDQSKKSIETLKILGAGIVLDDFGTGYSSLAYVNRLPLDKIKVDQSFTRQIETDVNSRNIVHSIIKLCHTMSLGCVVEGVETEAQADIARGFDCDFIQGYLFGRPMSPSDVLLHLSQSSSVDDRIRKPA